MRTGRLAALGALALLAGGCGLGDAWQTLAWPADQTPLERVLAGAEDTPGKQSLLYTAMAEAEAAAQGADRALAAADNIEDVRSALGEVLYAIDPDLAPDWRAKRAGIVPGWAGKGYGLRRALDGMAQGLREVASAGGQASEAAGLALLCVHNTRERADELVELTTQAITAGERSALVALLPEIDALARRLNQGHDAANDGEIAFTERECGLQQAARALRAVTI